MYIFICHQVCGVWCGVSELWRDPVLWGVETPHGCGGREGGRDTTSLLSLLQCLLVSTGQS